MHLLTGLGIGLLGLSSMTTSAKLVDPLIGEVSARPARQVAITANTEIRVVEGSHRWFNERWNDLLDIEGEWTELESARGVVLRPSSKDCTIGIYCHMDDEVLYFPVPEVGEVTFIDGWIRINQWGRSNQLATGWGMSAALMDEPEDDCDARFDSTTVSGLEFDGDCWTEGPGMEEGCSTTMSCLGSGSADCSVEFYSSSGTRTQTMSFTGSCGGSLAISLCQDDSGNPVYCVMTE